MAAAVIDALRRFLPAHLREHRHAMGEAQRRAVWAITHCRTAEMGGHLHACGQMRHPRVPLPFLQPPLLPAVRQGRHRAMGGTRARQTRRRALLHGHLHLARGTAPAVLHPQAKEIYQLFFAAASSALSDTLANPKWLGAKTSGFTMVLHTWNQRLHFHPHIHCIVPGAGIDENGRVVTVKNANFLVPQPALRGVFRARFRDGLADLNQKKSTACPPSIPPSGKRTGACTCNPSAAAKTSSNISAPMSAAPPSATRASLP
jgi:hypothetical protein